MARLWSSGAELNAATASIEVDTGGGVSDIVTSPVRSGTYSFRAKKTSSGHVPYQHKIGAQINRNLWGRIYLYIVTLPAAATHTIMQLDNGGSVRAAIRLTSGGVLRLYDDGGAQVGSDSSSLSLNTWYRVELAMDQKTSVGNITADAKLDGTSFASGTYASSQNSDTFQFGGLENTTFEYNFDDIALNDDSGSFQNSFPGAGSIIHLVPDSNGDNSGWLGSDLDSTDNYLLVDEAPPDDSTTDVTAGVNNTIDDYNIQDTPAAIASGDTINVVQVGVRFNNSVSAGTDPTFVLRIKASSGGTTEESANITAPDTTWVTNSATAANGQPGAYKLTLYDLPGASTTAWTKADLDTAQIGIRLSNTPTGLAQITTIWLLVEYNPAAPAGGEVTGKAGMGLLRVGNA